MSPSEPNQLTEEEAEGVKMIQTLQRVNNIEESDEDALAGWRAMSESQRATTRTVYLLFGPISKQNAECN